LDSAILASIPVTFRPVYRYTGRPWEGGDLGTADWGCLAGRCASLCLQAAHGGRAAGGSG